MGGLRDSQRQPPAVPYEPRGGHRPTVLRELRFACREAALCQADTTLFWQCEFGHCKGRANFSCEER